MSPAARDVVVEAGATVAGRYCAAQALRSPYAQAARAAGKCARGPAAGRVVAHRSSWGLEDQGRCTAVNAAVSPVQSTSSGATEFGAFRVA